MLSHITCKILELIFINCFRFGTFPYEWNPMTQSLVTTTSRLKLARWYFAVGFTCFNSVFVGIRVWQGANELGVSLGQTFLNFYLWVCWTTTALMNINTVVNRESVAELVNQLLKTSRILKETFLSPYDQAEWKDGFELPNLALTKLAYSYFGMQFFAFLAMRNSPIYMYSLFANKNDHKIYFLIPWAFFEAIVTIMAAQIILFYGMIFEVYLISATTSLRKLKFDNNPSLPFDMFLKLYRHLQIANTNFNSNYKHFIQPVFVSWLLLVNVTSSYAVFKLYEEMGMPAYLANPFMAALTTCIALVIYPSCFKIRSLSDNVIGSWKHQRNLRNSSKFVSLSLSAFQPVGIRVGEFYEIKRETVMSYFQCVFDYAIMLLLTF